VDDARRDVEGLSRPDPLGDPVDGHLELARDHVDRLRRVDVDVSGQRPARGRLVEQQAERPAGVVTAQLDLGPHPARHPDDLRFRGHDPTLIRDGARDECAIEPVLAGSGERSARRRGAPGIILRAMPIRDDRRRKASTAIAARSLPALLVLAAVSIANSSHTVPTGGDR
jgi:hypothetical protein